MSEEKSDESFWKGMAMKHWLAALIFILAFVGAVIGFFYVLLTFITNSEVGGYGTWNIGQFSVGTAILWILLLILWEFLLIFLPFIGFCCILVAIYWFVILSDEDKEEIKARDRKEKDKKKQRRQGESGGASALFTIAFLIVVFVQGQWLTPFGSLPYTYWIMAWLTGFIWVCIVFGIPLAIIIIIYLVYRSKRKTD
jgi:hypothetical protein